MAIIDTTKTNKPFINDRDNSIQIGLDMPFRIGNIGEGWGASTQTTLQAVSNNLRNLIATETGERLYQPNLGIALRQYLFEPFGQDVIDGVSQSIFEAVGYWLPFINIEDIKINMSDNQAGDFKSVMKVKVTFSLKRDPNTLESIQVTIGG